MVTAQNDQIPIQTGRLGEIMDETDEIGRGHA